MTTSPPRRRRGRQPRPSLLSSRVKAAVAAFAIQVGQPRVIEPAGFRDFRGWLSFIGGPAAITAWAPLVDAVLRDTASDIRRIDAIKHDLVREIVKAVVIPREGESSKLVSTNCGRQCARPLNGVTLMTILDRMFDNIRQWKEIISAVASSQSSGQLHFSSRSLPSTAGPLAAEHFPASSSAQPKLTYSTAPHASAYNGNGFGGSSSQHAAHHHSHNHTSSHAVRPPSTRSPQPRSHSSRAQPSRAHTTSHAHNNSRWVSSSHHDHANASHHSSQARQEETASGSRPLPSFQELEDSLQGPAYLGKRSRRL